MPELPETETIARELHRLVSGRTVSHVDILRPDVLRGASPGEFAARCAGREVSRAWRRAKSVIIDLAGGEHIVVTPRFTGALLVDPARRVTSPVAAPSATAATAATAANPALTAASGDDDQTYWTVRWTLADGGSLVYRDVRRLGTVAICNTAALAAFEARLGVEPLDPAFDAERLSVLLRGSRQAVKKVLMDQRQLAGVGNIYANEALWRAGIDPSRAARSLDLGDAGRLRDALVEILEASIAARGTTFRDYRDPSDRQGGYAASLSAYGRGDLPCPRCGNTLVETHAIDGRSTVFCWRCQS